MAIAFTYTESTNTIVVTGGTSGTPATFADFVTADRAGTATLLAATAGLSPTLALTYQIRPVDVIALLITFTVASKTAEADHIFITGTDWRDAAQTEAIDVTAGNGAYVSTKYFRTITNIDCSDNAAGGGTVWANGTVAVTQPQWGVIWDLRYRIEAFLAVGDGSTATYFADFSKQIFFPSITTGTSQSLIRVYNNAVLEFGKLDDLTTKRTSRGIQFLEDGDHWNTYQIRCDSGSGKVYLYGSTFENTGNSNAHRMRVKGAAIDDVRVWNCAFVGWIGFTLSIGSFYNVRIDRYQAAYAFHETTGTLDNVWFNTCKQGIFAFNNTLQRITNLRSIGTTNEAFVLQSLNAFDLEVVDAIQDNWTINWVATSAYTMQRIYTFNLHISDKDGNNLSGVTVDCEDTNTDAVWTAGTITTDANGDIPEQEITYGYYDQANGNTLQELSPHKFTISKAGYESLILNDITIDAPIAWHLELQPMRARVLGRPSRRISAPNFQ